MRNAMCCCREKSPVLALGLTAIVLGLLLAGCPRQDEQSSLVTPGTGGNSSGSPVITPTPSVLHPLPPGVAEVLNADPIEAPTAGASALANTRWEGTQDCMLTGDYNMLLSGFGMDPKSETLRLDERGIPTDFRSGFPYQFKRATFTEDSFNVAGTAVMSTSISEPISTAYVLIMSGQRSADGRTLTGRRQWGVVYAAGGPDVDVAVIYDCTLNLALDE